MHISLVLAIRRDFRCCKKTFVSSEIGKFNLKGFLIGTEVAFKYFHECLCLRGLRLFMETQLHPGNGLLAPTGKKGIDYVRKCFSQSNTQNYGC